MPDLASLARQDAVVVAAGGWDTLVVSGPDRAKWLEGLVTCEVAQVLPGRGAWGLALNRLGKIQSVVWLLESGNQLWLAAAPGTGDALLHELGRMLIMEDAELERAAPARRWFGLHGPGAGNLAADLAGRLGGVWGNIDWTGLGGAALMVDERHAEAVASACTGRWLDGDAWTRLRLERGLGEFGVDFGEQDRPHEAALERRAVNWSKGCYLGQEVVCMQDMRGKVKRRVELLGIEAPAHSSCEPGATILAADDRAIGVVTSCAFSERARRWLALAKLDLEFAAGALRYKSKSGAELWPASVTAPV